MPVVVLCLALTGTLAAAEPSASDLFRQGRKAEKAGRMAQAYLLYSQAAALEPKNSLYWLRSQAVKSRAALQAKTVPSVSAYAATAIPDLAVPPEEAFPPATAEDLAEAKKPLPPQELAAKGGRQDFDIKGDAKTVWEKVAKAWGLDCVFDGDYQPAPSVRFQVEDADYRESLHELEAATGSFVIPITDKVFLVAKDTPQKRQELEPTAAITVSLREPTSQQDFTSLITAVQQSLGIEKVAFDSAQSMVVMRDRVSKIVPARLMLAELLRPRAQVVLDVEFLEVSLNDLITWGVTLQNMFSITPIIPRTSGGAVSYSSGTATLAEAFRWFRMLGSGGAASLFGVGIASQAMVAQMSRSTGNLLMKSQMRSIDGQPATLHVGDRYPIMTSGYFGPASFSTGGTAYAPIPSFTFEDLGLSIKATPNVHGLDAVSLELDTEFKVLAGQALNGIPIIANRMMKTKVRLNFGQWAVVGGLLNSSETRTIAGLAGLSRVPVLSALVNQHKNQKAGSEVLLLIRPELVTLPPGSAMTHEFRVGSETRPLTPL